ncbi:MAG: AAA family ATPase [Bacteroidales bacterium]|nr:AAA family ATPase [Bacteroidales bacterium]
MQLKINNFGQIQDADVEFGDLTIVVGQQASGKTLFLELLKLLHEAKGISARYEEIFPRTTDEKIKAYFGQGMEGILTNDTVISFDGKSVKNLIFGTPAAMKKLTKYSTSPHNAHCV